MNRNLWQVMAAAALTACLPGLALSAGLQLSAPLSDPYEQALYERACALFQPELLPADSPLVPRTAICGTPLVMSIAASWPRLSKPAREAFAELFYRPVRTRTLVTEEGHFKIHYNTAGLDGVDPTDDDANGVPDYVDEVARTVESVWRRQVDDLGYAEPVDDGDGLYDIYIGNLASRYSYGFTWPTDFGDPTSAAYLEIDNDYADAIYQTRGIDGLHVTVSHEFHHAIQFAYFASDLVWWHELTATWMEEVVYPDVNDYLQYVDVVMAYPSASLDRWSTGSDEYPYGASIFAQYLAKVYGANALRNTWEALNAANPAAYRIETIDGALPGGGFAGLLPGYAVWNYLTGTRWRSGYYPEGDLYPAAATDTAAVPQNGTVSGSGLIDHLGVRYIEVPTASLARGLQATFTFEEGGNWLLAALLVGPSRVEAVQSSGEMMAIPNVSDSEHVVFIPIVRALEGEDYAYTYSITSLDVPGSGSGMKPLPVGGGGAEAADFDGNGRVDFLDFLSFARVYGSVSGDGVYQAAFDLDADGQIDFSDFLSFAQVYGAQLQ